MNVFTDIVFIFVFVFVILHFGLINITTSNVVTQKLFMFIAVTLFATMMSVMKSVRRQSPIKMWNSLSTGLIIGMLAFVGHTVLFDLWYMPETNSWLMSAVDGQYITLNILLALFISTSIAVGRSVTFLFNTEMCE
ncbi:hypothetical protein YASMINEVIRUS_790 [Yasminevirus sp. GU-2018]|uniref:Uncharacterized protein n=1 Tax=Yasminevirus sp. GU-2018 TaxID=2420051 RepID=A0A5K0U8U9_9VIRU|nr:hypothetical protein YASMINEVIRUS_790 [Yasminevirus sp. GU-2018]